MTALGARGSLASRLTNKSDAEQNAILILSVYSLLIIYILLKVFAAPFRIINAASSPRTWDFNESLRAFADLNQDKPGSSEMRQISIALAAFMLRDL